MSWHIDDELAESLGMTVTQNDDGSTSYTYGGGSGGESDDNGGDDGYSYRMPDMSRRTDLAGRTVYSNGMNVSYDPNGYAVRATNVNHPDFAGTDRSVRAQSIDAASRMATDPNNLDAQVMSNKNLQDLLQIRNDLAAGKISLEAANAYANALRNLYGYSGGLDGATYSKIGLTTFDPDDVTTQPFSKDFAANPNTDWTIWTQPYISGQQYAGPVDSLQNGQFTPSPYARTPYPESGYATGSTGYTGITGGVTNPGTVPVGSTQATPVTTGTQTTGNYGNRPEYASQYMELINKLANDLNNRDPFSYDVNSDPLYRQYADMYTRNGQNAMQDILGQLSARTGGMANSWAGTMAQQGYNNYMQQLNDTIPQLYQQAYGRYQDDESRLRRNMDMWLALEDQDYNKYLQELAQWNTDRGFDYNAFRDAVGDARYMDEQTYKQWRDAMSDMQWAAGQQQAADDAAAAAAEYQTTFTPQQILSYAKDKDGNIDVSKLTGKMLDDYYYYWFGIVPGAGGEETPTVPEGAETPAAPTGTAGGGGTTGGTRSGGNGTQSATGKTVNNGGLDNQAVRDAQSAWNKAHPDKQIAVDGSWGPDSQKKTGYASAADAYYDLVSGKANNPNGYVPMGVLNSETNGSGTNTGGTRTGGTAVYSPAMAGIPQWVIDSVNQNAEGGMTTENLLNVILSYIDRGIITKEQGDALAASFGF